MTEHIARTLKGLKAGRITISKAIRDFKDLPYKDLGFAKVDNHRSLRRGFPEVIFGKGKTPEQIIRIAKRIIAHDGILLITHADKKVYSSLRKVYPKIGYAKKAGLISYRKDRPAY